MWRNGATLMLRPVPEEGPVTLFDVPGEYRGRFTVAGGGHGATGDVFSITVIVRKPGS